MKVKILAVISGLVLMTFQGLVMAQENTNPPQSIRASIAIDSATLERHKPAIVTITIENISDREIDLNLTSSFKLLNMSKEARARKSAVVGDTYWSPVNIVTGTPLGLRIVEPEKLEKGVVVGSVPRDSLRFEKNEIRMFKVDLTKVFWNDGILGGWPSESLFEVVPKGSYSLHLEMRGDSRVTSNELNVWVK